MREGLSVLFARAGMEVVGGVANGREAVRLAQELAPDVVVMDLTMPDMNGIEATRQLRARAPDVQVVVLSMHSTGEHVYRALEAGAMAYVLKDAAGAELLSAVRAVCSGRRYVSPALGDLPAPGVRRAPLDALSARERQVLQLVVEGRTSAEIARTVHLSPKSVQTYRSRLMRKLRMRDLPALVKFAIEHGLTPPA